MAGGERLGLLTEGLQVRVLPQAPNINQAHDPRIYETFDFAVSEQCVQYKESGFFTDFLRLNKPVFLAEYKVAPTVFCPQAKALRISAIKKRASQHHPDRLQFLLLRSLSGGPAGVRPLVEQVLLPLLVALGEQPHQMAPCV